MKSKVLFFLFLAFLLLLGSASGAAVVVSSGAATLDGTYCFSFDSGTQSAAGQNCLTSPWDVWWDQITDVERQMVPEGTATIVNIGVVNFNSITLGYLESLTYSATPIDGNNDQTNKLVEGDVFAVHTNGGNYAKVLITSYGYNLGIQWVTMSPPPPASFAAAVPYTVASTPYSVALGDFNGDGITDMVVVSYISSANVSVLLGNGNGTFTLKETYSAGGYPTSVAVGDFNRDGKLDFAVANWEGGVSVFLGNGDGTFQGPATYTAGTNPSSVAVGDFNGDGWPDLAVANNGDGTVSVLLNNGTESPGTFATAASYSVGTDYPRWVAVGSFRGNGILDLAVADFNSAGLVSVLLGKGDGTFQSAVTYAAGTQPSSVAVADFNGDGKLDLAVASTVPGTSGEVGVLLGNGDGTFQTPATYYQVGTDVFSVAVGDFNVDGIPDLAVTDGGSNSVKVLLGNGDGSFQAPTSYAAGTAPISVAVGDFNGDGKPDLAVADQNGATVSVLLNTTSVTMQPSSPTNLTQQYVLNPSPPQSLAFNLNYTTAYTAGTLTVAPDTVPTVSDPGVTQANYTTMVAGTSLATTTCYIAPGAGTDSSGNPLCAKIKLTCTNSENTTPAGDNCPTSKKRNLFWANQLETSTPIGGTTSSIAAGTAPTLAMGSDAWSPTSSCTLTGPEANELCPHSILTQFLETSTDPAIKGGGTGTSSNSTFILGCCEPEWTTTVTVPAWTNSTSVPVSFTTSPPAAPSPNPNNWVAAPNQSMTWGVEVLGATPDPTFPISTDTIVANSAACPSEWSSAVAESTNYSGTVTVPGQGLYEVHYFSTACDQQEELVFTSSTVPTQNWAAFKTVSFGVDTTDPTITTPVLSTSNPIVVNSTVTASFTCTDPTTDTLGNTVVASGLAGCGNQVTPAPGNAVSAAPSPGSSPINVSNFQVPTSAVGSQTLTVYATDLAGNTASASVSYTVSQASTTTTVSTSGSSVAGQSYTVSVTVTPEFSGTTTPTGNVAVIDGAGGSCGITLSSGAGSCSLTSTVAGKLTVKASYSGDPNFTGSFGTATQTVGPGPVAKLLLSALSTTVTAGQSQAYTAAGFDAYNNPAGDVTASTIFGILPNGSCLGASCTATVADVNGSVHTVTGTYTNGANGSMSVGVTPASFSQLQLLLPGETPEPGTADFTGTPNTQYVNGPFNVTVNAVDQYWNVVNTVTDMVGITSNDSKAVLPADAQLASGTGTFTVTLETPSPPATTTLTASDVSNSAITASTSPVIPVIVVYTASISPADAGTGQATNYTLTVNNVNNPPSLNTNSLGSLSVAIPANGGTPSSISVTATQPNAAPATWGYDITTSTTSMMNFRRCTLNGGLSFDGCSNEGSNAIQPGGTITIQFTSTPNETVTTTPVTEVWTTTAYSDAAYTNALPLAPPEPTVSIGAAPTITSASGTTFTYNSAGTFTVTTTGVPTPSLTESGTLPGGVTFTDNGNRTATLAGTPNAAGSYPITITAHNGYGSDATQTFTLTVNPAGQTITVTMAAPGTANYGATFSVAATASSALAAAITTSAGCSGSGSGSATITMTSGTTACTVVFNQAGNTDYSAAPQVTSQTTANKIAPTVSFTGAPTSAVFNSTFTVKATTNASTTAAITASGVCSVGPLAYPTSSTGTVTTATVTMTSGTGTCGLTASWAADNNYLAASASQSTGAVKAGSTTTITSTPDPSAPGHAVLVSFTVTGNGLPTGTVTVSASTGEACSPVTLIAGAGSCSLTFVTDGSRTLTATYSGDGNFNGSSAGVTQTVNGPLASLSPASVNFGNVYLGLAAVRTVTFTNVGNAAMSVGKVQVSGGNDSDDFIPVSLCPSTLAAGNSCQIVVTFTADSDYYSPTGVLSVVDSAYNSPQTDPLSGTVINPKASLSTYSLSFGKQKVGTKSAAETVTLTNTGTGPTPLILSGLTISGDFAFGSGTTCSSAATLAAGASCTISVTFTPTATGSRSGKVVITDNALSSPQTISLSGKGD